MKKYLGSSVDAFAAIIAPLFIFFPLVFGVNLLSASVDIARVILIIGCVLCIIVWSLYLKQISIQLYSWGHFLEKGILVKTLGAKSCFIVYTKCLGCGIGYYTHGILNSHVGTKIYYIFLSYDKFDEHYRTKINMWKPTKTQIKIRFNKKVYDFLVAVLPRSQAKALEQDYRNYYGTQGHPVH